MTLTDLGITRKNFWINPPNMASVTQTIEVALDFRSSAGLANTSELKVWHIFALLHHEDPRNGLTEIYSELTANDK